MEIFQTFVALIMSFVATFSTFIAGVGNTITGIADFFTKPSVIADFEEKNEDSIRIMSFNIRYGDLGNRTAEDRYEDVEKTIENGHPDSVGLQEATPEWMAYLTANLEDYDYVGVGRDNGVDEGEFAAIFYLKDVYTVTDSGTFWLSETPDVPSIGWGADCYRICTWAILKNIETGAEYVHMNAHFDFANDEVRYNSINMIAEKAAEFAEYPVVYTADMNFNENSVYYNTLIEKGVLSDTKKSAEDTMDYLTYHDRKPLFTQSILDYVMINDKFDANVYRVVTAGIGGRYVSDHFPVYADISFK